MVLCYTGCSSATEMGVELTAGTAIVDEGPVKP